MRIVSISRDSVSRWKDGADVPILSLPSSLPLLPLPPCVPHSRLVISLSFLPPPPPPVILAITLLCSLTCYYYHLYKYITISIDNSRLTITITWSVVQPNVRRPLYVHVPFTLVNGVSVVFPKRGEERDAAAFVPSITRRSPIASGRDVPRDETASNGYNSRMLC